jgi:hypothetical protein
MAGVEPLQSTAEQALLQPVGAALGVAQAPTELVVAPPGLSVPLASAVASMDGVELLLNTAGNRRGRAFMVLRGRDVGDCTRQEIAVC